MNQTTISKLVAHNLKLSELINPADVRPFSNGDLVEVRQTEGSAEIYFCFHDKLVEPQLPPEALKTFNNSDGKMAVVFEANRGYANLYVKFGTETAIGKLAMLKVKWDANETDFAPNGKTSIAVGRVLSTMHGIMTYCNSDELQKFLRENPPTSA